MPRKTGLRPTAQAWYLRATWLPPSEKTPALVQPGKGITRSAAPVAMMSASNGSSPKRSLVTSKRCTTRSWTCQASVEGR